MTRSWLWLTTFVLDILLMGLFVLAVATLFFPMGRALGLLVAGVSIAVFLAVSIGDQLRIRQDDGKVIPGRRR